MADATQDLDSATDDRRRKRRKDARPQEILDAALAEFASRGFAATRVEDIAARAGVSKGVVYLYFDNKVALFEALIRNGVLPNVEHIERLAERAEGSAVDALRAIFAFVQVRFEQSNLPKLPQIVLAEAVNYPQFARLYRVEVIDRVTAAFARVLERGVRRGEFRAIRPQDTARVLMMPMWGVVFRRSLYDTEFEPARHLAAHLDVFLNGIRAGRDV
jgi:AcrR family transcriptional regulator